MPGIVTFYADLWIENVAQYADFGDVYGWLAVASLLVAVVGLVFAILRRADGIQAAGLVGQHFLVFGVPFVVGGLLAAAG